MWKELTDMAKKILEEPADCVQAICSVLLIAILVCWPIITIASAAQAESREFSWDRSETQRLLDRQASLDKALAVLQDSVSQHHNEQESQHFPERVAVLETRASAVDNKLNMILGALVTLSGAFISDFIRRIRMDRVRS